MEVVGGWLAGLRVYEVQNAESGDNYVDDSRCGDSDDGDDVGCW